MLKAGFIGCGNMGGALAKAAAKSNNEIYLADYMPQKAAELAAELGAKQTDNENIVTVCDYIFLGVKPQVMPSVLDSLSAVLSERKDRFVLVSMAAGLSIDKIRSMAKGDYPVIRIMPNTPAAVGKGMLLYTTADVTQEEKDAFCELMKGAGRLDEISENLIDSASALSGCGPAFVCQFIESLADGAVACGLPRDKALFYAAVTLEGTAGLMLESGQHPGVLKDSVCSPGGSTIEGVRRLEEGTFRASVIDAVIASYKKTKELGK